MALNGDQLFEIFSWLPAKTLHKVATVAKPCLDLMSETRFMEIQCRHSMLKSEDSFFIDEDSCLRSNAENLLFGALPQSQPATVGLPPESLAFLAKKGRILASSNGLLLCRMTDYNIERTELFLCNPATRTWLPISLPHSYIKNAYKSNWDVDVLLLCGSRSFSNNRRFPLDYSLLLFELDVSEEWSDTYKVHMFEDGRWVLKAHDFHTGGRGLDFAHPVQTKHNIYFMSDCGAYLRPRCPSYWPYIICYDVHLGTTRKIALPNEACDDYRSYTMQIFGWEPCEENKSYFKSLCLVKSGVARFSVWVLEDTEDPNSWHKLKDDTDIMDDLGIKDTCYWGVSCIIMGKRLVFATDRYIYSYGLEGDECGDLRVICNNICRRSTVRFSSFCNTLRPCRKDNVDSPRLIK